MYVHSKKYKGVVNCKPFNLKVVKSKPKAMMWKLKNVIFFIITPTLEHVENINFWSEAVWI